MYLRNRLFFTCLALLNLWVLNSQTLYWIGGTGNFNDPKHWSTFSGGFSAGNQVPNKNTSVVFANQHTNDPYTVYFPTSSEVADVRVETQDIMRFEKTGLASKLIVHGNFEVDLRGKFISSAIDIEFNGLSNSEKSISGGFFSSEGNVTIKQGSWRVRNLLLSKGANLEIVGAKVNFDNAFVTANSIQIKNGGPFNSLRTKFTVADKFEVTGSAGFNSVSSSLNKKLLPENFVSFNYAAPVASSGRLGQNQINALITGTNAIAPTCSPGCDGKIILTIPAFSNYFTPTPTAVIVSVGNGTCNAVAGLTIVTPGTYTLSNICTCGNLYNIFLTDETLINDLESFQVAIVQPNINFNANIANTRSLTCPGVCTGSVGVSAAFGTAPYNFTVTPPTGPQTFSTSNGNINQSGLCAGTLSISVRDAANCTAVFSRTIATPAPLVPAAITTSVSCFGAGNGIYAITPSGGTSNYTITFAPGGSFASSGAAVSLTNLSPSAISATLTDSRGCVTTTNTTILEPTDFTVTAAQSTINCFGSCDGFASVSVIGVSGGNGAGSYSYTWTPVTANTSTNGTLCAGPNSVLIKDNILGCSTIKPFIITEIPAIAISSSVITNVVCNSSLTGAFNATVIGGTPNYTMTLVNPISTIVSASTNTLINILNLSADNYTLSLLDAAGCSRSFSFSISQPPASTLTALTQSNTCPGGTTGAATLQPSGGNGGGFSFNWIGGNSSTASNLATGNYTAYATDVLGCNTQTITVSIVEPPTFVFAFQTQSVTCFNAATGALTVTPSGGSSPYSFTLTNSLGSTTNTTGLFSGLPGSPNGVGLYTLSVGDSFFPGSCSQSTVFSIAQPTQAVIASATFTNPTCAGFCNAALTGSTNGGGTPGYTYSWTIPGPSTVLSQTLINRCQGTYTLDVTDSKGCVAPRIFVTVTDPTSMTISFVTTSVSCAPGQGISNNGSITTILSGGTSPYSFTWTPTVGSPTLTQNISNLTAGAYTLRYKDNNNCTPTPPTTVVTVGSPTAMVLSQSTASTSCASLCDGQATVSVVSGGKAAFSYSYTGSTNSTNGTGNFASVCGPFTVSVMDNNLCVATITSVVGSPPVYNPVFTQTNVTCFGSCDGKIQTTPSGGISPYNYTLTGSAPPLTVTATGNSALFTNLCADSYTLTLQDSRLPATCPQSFTIDITQPANSLTSTPTSVAASCFSVCDGQLFASNASGGTGPFTYVWSNAVTSVTAQNVGARCAGTYSLRVSDNNGCAFTTTTSISEPSQIVITSSVLTGPSCFGGNNGSATITASGGPSTAYSYSWTPSAQTTSIATSLTAQTYTIKITSATCNQSYTVPITQPASITIVQTNTAVNCLGSCDGLATLSVTAGGIGAFSYSINSAPSQLNGSGLFSALCSSVFIARVTDGNGCSNTITVPIGSPATSVAITGVATRSSCATCSGGATVTAVGGTPPYSFVYTNSLGIVPGQTTNIASALCPGPYTVTALDSKLCSANFAFTINPVIIIASTVGGTTSCFGTPDGSVAVTGVAGGAPSYSFSWTPSAATTSVVTNLAAGVYTVLITDSSTPLNCVASAVATVVPAASITVLGNTSNVTCPGLLNGLVTTTVSGGPVAGAISYSWSPTGVTTSSVPNANFGVHTVTVTKGTCTTSASFTVGSPNPPIAAIVNSVNPNNCTTPNNGSITIVASGGDGTFTYSWNPTGSTSFSIGNLTPGVYQVTVTSAGCSTVFPSTLVAPLAPSLTAISSQSIACFSASTGVLSFSTAATSPSFTWSPATTSVISGGTITANNLTAGSYTLRLSDFNNCTNSVSIIVAQAPSLTVVSAQTNVACFTGSTGIISASVSGGTPGVPSYTFNWSNGTNATGTLSAINSLTAIAAGAIYSVNIRDNNNCIVSRSFTLTEPAPFTFTTNSANVTCLGSANGSIAVIANPSTGVTYNWPPVPSATFAGSTNSVLTGLNPGSYTVSVSNGTCNAIGINTIVITQPTILTSTLTVNHNVTCFNGNNGKATFSVSGGNGAYTYTWVNSTATTAIASSLTVGNYTAIVVDAQGCTTVAPFSISGPANFNATLTATNPKCIGAFNGSITTQVTGGQGTINYAWIPVGSGQSPTGLSAGLGALVYTLNASDDSLCVVTKTIQLNDPPPIGAGLTFTNPVCFGNCNGVAISTPTGVVGTPTISWLPSGLIANSISGLCSNPLNGSPNIYTVSIVDGNGCTNAATFALSIPQQITASYTVGPALCQTPNGSVTVIGSGGTGALTYSWLPPVNSTNTVLTNLASGSYSLQIKDINNCTNTVIVPVSASNGPTATVASNSIQCFGQCNGTATVSAISATNITLQWLPPLASTVTTTTLNNLCAGSYTVELTDPSNNCKSFVGVQINTPPIISIVTATTGPTCFGICNGSITVNASGGTPTYSYNWSGPNSFTASASTLTNICGGDYSLTITDANTCTFSPVISIPVLNNIIIQQPVSVVNNVCFGDCQGSATVNVVSTTTNVLTATINWSNSQFGNVATGLCAGIYSVMVTDTRGCSNTFSVPVSSAPEMSLSATVAQPQCNQCNGSATVSATGGNGPVYTYTWNNGPTSNEANNLCAGLYQVLVKDNSNCTQLENIIINNSNGIASDTVKTKDETCLATCNGAGTITAYGGASPISYNWINPNLSVSSPTAANLCPGTYFVQMTDANNCIRTSSLLINAAIELTVATFVTPPTCTPVPAPGFLQAIVSGNSGALSYSWSPGGITTYSLGNAGPGTYTLIVTDNGTGCSKTIVLPVSNLAGPQFSLTTRDADCVNLGSATVVPTGTAPLTYLWSTGATSSVIGSLVKGPLSLTVTALNGCVSLSNVFIDIEPELEVNTITQKLLCHNDCNGGITLFAVNGNLPLTYSLTGGSSAYQTFSLCSGSYTATVTDTKGCFVTSTVNLINPAVITFTTNSINSSCSTLADGSASLAISGGRAPYSYTLAGANSFTSTASPFTNLLNGQYTLNVVDTLGCKSNTALVTIVPTVTVDAVATPNFSVCIGTDVRVSAAGSQGALNYVWTDLGTNSNVSNIVSYSMTVFETQTLQVLVTSTNVNCFDTDTVIVSIFPKPFLDAGPATYTMSVYSSTMIGGNPTSLTGGPTHTWAPAEFLDSPESQNPVASNTLNTTFTVSIAYGDACLESDTVQVLIIPQVRISSGFSPNGDGKNDLFIIDYIDQFPLNTVEIYNRWGDLLFYSKGYETPWDGNFKGQQLPVGTYYYVIHLNHFAYTKPITGPVTIFR